MSKKRIIVGLSVVCLLWIGNMFYFYSQQLDEPMFLKQYYELSSNDDVEFSISYLVNNKDNEKLLYIQIPQLSDINIYVENCENNKYTYHTLKETIVKINREDLEKVLNSDEFRFTDVIAYFNNGYEKRVNIGEIIIYDKESYNRNDSPFEFCSSGSSSNYTGYITVNVKETVILEGLRYNLEEKLDGFLYVYIRTNKQTISKFNDRSKQLSYIKEQSNLTNYPLNLIANEEIDINYQFLSEDIEDNRYYNYYDICGRLLVKKVSGNQYIKEYTMYYRPNFDNSDIRKIIKEQLKRG